MSAVNDFFSSPVSFLRSSSESFLTMMSSDSCQSSSSGSKPAVEALVEVLGAALELALELVDALALLGEQTIDLGLHLALEAVEVAPARLLIDLRDDRRSEVEDLLELLRSHVEQIADPARDALEEPDVADRSGQVDVTHALTANLRARDLDAAALADDALVADALVLAAVALPVLGRTEDALAEEAVLLRLERAVVDRLGLGDLARGPRADLLGRREADLDGVEVVDVDHVNPLPGGDPARPTGRGCPAVWRRVKLVVRPLAVRAWALGMVVARARAHSSASSSARSMSSPISMSSRPDGTATRLVGGLVLVDRGLGRLLAAPPRRRRRPHRSRRGRRTDRCRAPRQRAAGRRPRRASPFACPLPRPR